MPGEVDELRSRQDRFGERQDLFERRLGRLEDTVETQATLRAAMDKDIADVKAEQRAQRALLQAVHDTQSDHTKRLTSIEGRVGNVETRLGNVETRLGNVETRLGQVEEKLGHVHVGVQTIIAVLDRKIDEEEAGQ
jgi:chromosome segregation ATPase